MLLLALVLRVVAGWWWQGRLEENFGFGDSLSYWELARTVAEREPYQYGSPDARVFRTPGYPVLLAGLYWLWGGEPPVLAARLASALLGTLAVGGVYWFGRSLVDRRVGLLAALGAAVYPGTVALGVFVLSEALFCPLMMAQLVCWVLTWRAASRAEGMVLAALAGVIGGLAVLARPSWLLFTPLALVLGGLLAADRRRHTWLGLVMLASLLLALVPWWIRNAHVTGHFVPTTLQVGASLYDGLNPQATGASDMAFVEPIAADERRDASDVPLEVRLDRRLRDEALAWARENPRRVLALASTKFLRMWNVWPNEDEFRSWPLRMAFFVTYTPLVLLALVGAWRYGRHWPLALAWVPAVYFTLLHMIFVSSLRYREPAMLALMVLAAAALVAPRETVEPRASSDPR